MGFPADVITTLNPVCEVSQENISIFLTMKSWVNSHKLYSALNLWVLGFFFFCPGVLSVALLKPEALPFTYSYPKKMLIFKTELSGSAVRQVTDRFL